MRRIQHASNHNASGRKEKTPLAVSVSSSVISSPNWDSAVQPYLVDRTGHDDILATNLSCHQKLNHGSMSEHISSAEVSHASMSYDDAKYFATGEY